MPLDRTRIYIVKEIGSRIKRKREMENNLNFKIQTIELEKVYLEVNSLRTIPLIIIKRDHELRRYYFGRKNAEYKSILKVKLILASRSENYVKRNL